MASWQFFVQKLFVNIGDLAALFIGGPAEFLILHFLASRAKLFERLKETEAGNIVEARNDLGTLKRPAEDAKARVSNPRNTRSSATCDKIRSQGMALLEQYAVFGTGPGEWSLSWDEGEEEYFANASEEGFDDKLDTEFKSDERIGACRTSAFALLEHYGAFGAAPGAWNGSPKPSPSASMRSWSECLVVEEEDEDLIDVAEEDFADELDADCKSDVRADAYRTNAFDLLEHYGVFGAAHGSWSGNSPPLPPASPCCWNERIDAEEEDEDLSETSKDHDVELDAGCEPSTQVRGCSGNALNLLEHYGVFGATPGAWSHSLPLPQSPLASRPSAWSERLVVAEEVSADMFKADSFDELGSATDYDVRSESCSIKAFASISPKTDNKVGPVLLGRTSNACPVLLGRTSKVGPVLLGRHSRVDGKIGLEDHVSGKSDGKKQILGCSK